MAGVHGCEAIDPVESVLVVIKNRASHEGMHALRVETSVLSAIRDISSRFHETSVLLVIRPLSVMARSHGLKP